MTVQTLNFSPNSAYTISASTSSANQALTQPPVLTGGGGNGGGYLTLVIYNATSGVAFLQPGMSSQTATTSSTYQVAPGAVKTFDMSSPFTNLGCILSASSGNVYVMLGSGT